MAKLKTPGNIVSSLAKQFNFVVWNLQLAQYWIYLLTGDSKIAMGQAEKEGVWSKVLEELNVGRGLCHA